MKHFSFILLYVFCALIIKAQSVAINNDGSIANPNAALDIKSATKGILIPRMDSVARKAIPHTKGLLVYDSTTNLFWYSDGTGWFSLARNRTKNIILYYVELSINQNFLATINLDGTDKKILPIQVPTNWQITGSARLTADGNTIVLIMRGDLYPRRSRIYTCSIDGNNLRLIYESQSDEWLELAGIF